MHNLLKENEYFDFIIINIIYFHVVDRNKIYCYYLNTQCLQRITEHFDEFYDFMITKIQFNQI